MPPIMGAAAFVMAAFPGIPYLQVAMYALIPAVLYFLAVFMAVHLEAKRTGMPGPPRAHLPRLPTFLQYTCTLSPPQVLLARDLLARYTSPFSALVTTPPPLAS